jgi:hypothetical protein
MMTGFDAPPGVEAKAVDGGSHDRLRDSDAFPLAFWAEPLEN